MSVIISVIKLIMWALQRIQLRNSGLVDNQLSTSLFLLVLVEKILAGQKANQRAVNVSLYISGILCCIP